MAPSRSTKLLDRREEILKGCERFLAWGRRRPYREVLQEATDAIGDEEQRDFYGRGEIVQSFEQEVADLLGKEEVLFFPTGTMTQQIALRIWSDRNDSKAVVFHPKCHLETHEEKGYQLLHGLQPRIAGQANRLLTLEDLDEIHGPIAALLLEVPQRDIGSQLPEWDDLVAQTNWAGDRGAAVHMDGARLWEAAPFYQKSYAEVAALFDSVYVSFYKSLGALAGAALAGPAEFIAEARVWRRRHGGDLFQFAPFVVSARARLRQGLPRMSAYCEEARRIAGLLRDIPGISLRPDPPHTNMLHLFLEGDAGEMMERALKIARDEKVYLFGDLDGTDVPGWSMVETVVEEPKSDLSDDEIRELFAFVVSGRKSGGDATDGVMRGCGAPGRANRLAQRALER